MSGSRSVRRRGARPDVPITSDAIIDAAFRMIDERGDEGFSMRSLANELGVFPATLYWHVGDRAQLMGLVQRRWLESVEAPDDIDDWQDWMIELAHRYRASAHRHPKVARLVSVERARNIDTLALPDAILGKLQHVGLSGEDLVHAYNALLGAVQGFIVMELSPTLDADPDEVLAAQKDLAAIDPERFPNISANYDRLVDRALSMRWTEASNNPLDESFDFLLQVLLSGLRAQIDTRRR